MKTIPILYQDNEIVVINKPAGLAVQGGQGIVNSVDTILPKQLNAPVYLVHRLDKDTQGILVTAKSSQAASKWTKLISVGQVKKEYLALCCGSPLADEGIIETPIIVRGVKKNARTHFKKIDEWEIIDSDKNVFSLLSLVLDTGRMHQIRIHLAQHNCPIAGDDKYGNFKLNKELRKKYGIKNLQLAAVKLTIPINSRKTAFEIPNPLIMPKLHDDGKDSGDVTT